MTYRGFAVMALKGGVGKTTILSAFARQLKKRVALLDLDYSNPCLNLAMGIDHARHRPLANYRIAPVPWEKGELASLALLTQPGSILRQAGEQRAQVIEDFIISIDWQPYEWLLIDTSPALSLENETILKVLDPEVIIVTEPGPLAQEGALRTALFVRTVKAKLLGIVGNRGYDAQELCDGLEVPYLGTVETAPSSEQVTVPDFTQFTSRRLGEADWVLKAKRWAVKQGLAALLPE